MIVVKEFLSMLTETKSPSVPDTPPEPLWLRPKRCRQGLYKKFFITAGSLIIIMMLVKSFAPLRRNSTRIWVS